MKDFFKPNDFICALSLNDLGILDLESKTLLAYVANKKLNALIESWPVVYGRNDKYGNMLCSFGNYQEKTDTHKARLAFIEEIKKEPCVHPKAHLVTFSNDSHRARCGICQVELQATWSEKT